MKKKILLVILILLLGVVFIFNNKQEETDGEKFAKEYGSVSSDNVFVYKDIDKIINILENGTGIVYLGFPECPWCTAYIVYLNEIAKENDIETIYYHNILEDRKNNTVEYQKIVSLLSDYLQYNEEGEKRLYVPAVIAIKKGQIIGFDDETAWDTKNYDTPKDYWANEDLESLKNKLRNMFIQTKTNTCTSNCNN